MTDFFGTTVKASVGPEGGAEFDESAQPETACTQATTYNHTRVTTAVQPGWAGCRHPRPTPRRCNGDQREEGLDIPAHAYQKTMTSINSMLDGCPPNDYLDE